MSDTGKQTEFQVHPWRRYTVLGVIMLVAGLLGARLVYLHVYNKDFLQAEGDSRALRVVEVAAHRGMITDRHGEPLAVSTPIDSIWVNPSEFNSERARWPELAKLLDMKTSQLARKVADKSHREFVYIKRHAHPDIAARAMALRIPGVALQTEYRRYYPAGEVSGHLLGFSDIDDKGREGIEASYDEWLREKTGAKRVLKDRLGNVIRDVESIRPARPGRDLTLSIDRRIQYLAYRELKKATQKHDAESGSAVVLDARTGEILAMVNQPSFNPNNFANRKGRLYRNRAVTDVFEPGSTIKPFTIAAALSSHRYNAQSPVDTSPGFLKIGKYTVRDPRNYGVIDVTRIIQKSSNVGATKLALDIDPRGMWDVLTGAGFGEISGANFSGEAAGLLVDYHHWKDIERATLAYGYGLSVTALQLARAYTIFANDGRLSPVKLLKHEATDELPDMPRVIDARVARSVRVMMETVIDEDGTGSEAGIPGYRVAGKTGTALKSEVGGYSDDRYIAVFAGMAPASRPRLVMVVMIDEPGGKEFYGGKVAAPVFSRVMAGALRLMNIPPDDLPGLRAQMAAAHVLTPGGDNAARVQ